MRNVALLDYSRQPLDTIARLNPSREDVPHSRDYPMVRRAERCLLAIVLLVCSERTQASEALLPTLRAPCALPTLAGSGLSNRRKSVRARNSDHAAWARRFRVRNTRRPRSVEPADACAGRFTAGGPPHKAQARGRVRFSTAPEFALLVKGM